MIKLGGKKQSQIIFAVLEAFPYSVLISQAGFLLWRLYLFHVKL